MKSSNLGTADGTSLTMTVAEYAKIAGVGEAAVRVKLAAGGVPFTKYGRLIRILRAPALAALGVQADGEPRDGAQ